MEIERDDDDFVLFRTTCKCSNPEHIVTVIVERSGEDEDPEVSLFFSVGSFERGSLPWWKRIRARIARACGLLWTGDLFLEDGFTFRDKGHLDDFIAALREADAQVRASGQKSGGSIS